MRYSEARQILAEALLDILEGQSMESPKPKSFNKYPKSFNTNKSPSISHPRPGTDPKSRLAMKKAAYVAALKGQRK
jgi:hypothetical protein